MGSEHGNRSNEIVKQNPEINHHEDDKPIVKENFVDFDSPSSASSSSSSSISSRDPNAGEENLNDISSAESEPDENLSPDCISSPDFTAPTTPQWSMGSASPLDNNPPSKFKPTTPLQTTGQPFDPNRIPITIFSTKPSNPMEWSTASNESLFSIQMGNNSFSQDHSILFGKPGEISWLDEWSLPPVLEVPSYDETSVKSGKVSTLEKEDPKKSSKVITENHHAKEEKMASTGMLTASATMDPPPESNLTSTSSRASSKTCLSNDSGNSGSSFAFPVFVDGGKTGSFEKEKPEQPQSEAQVSELSPPKSSKMRLCSFFSRWPRCC